MTEATELREMLEAERVRQGVTISELAKRLGVQYGAVRHLLHGRRQNYPITLPKAQRIARALDVRLVLALEPVDPSDALDDLGVRL